MSKTPYRVDDQFFLETLMGFGAETKERKIAKFIVVRVNATSAYAVPYNRMAEYREDPVGKSAMQVRIEQRTHKPVPQGFIRYQLWRNEEEFHQDVTKEGEKESLLRSARRIVEKLPVEELEEFVASHQKLLKG